MYWAAATDFFVYPYTGFDLSTVVDSVGPTGTVASRMDRFIRAATKRLEEVLTDSKSRNAALYARYAAGKRGALQIVFVGVEGNRPTYRSVTLTPKEIKGQIIITTQRLKRIAPTQQQPVVGNGMGWYEAAFPYLKARIGPLWRDPAGTIRESLKAQAAASPRAVSAPFSILRIDAHGARWMDRGKCQ